MTDKKSVDGRYLSRDGGRVFSPPAMNFMPIHLLFMLSRIIIIIHVNALLCAGLNTLFDVDCSDG